MEVFSSRVLFSTQISTPYINSRRTESTPQFFKIHLSVDDSPNLEPAPVCPLPVCILCTDFLSDPLKTHRVTRSKCAENSSTWLVQGSGGSQFSGEMPARADLEKIIAPAREKCISIHRENPE